MERLTHKSKFFAILFICILVFVFLNELIIEQWQGRAPSYYSSYDRIVEGWDLNVSRVPSQYIMPSNITTLMKPKEFCDKPVFLLIMVCSAPQNFEARKAIRETWGQDLDVLNKTLQTIFLMGETNNSTLQQLINEEAEEHNDIIQEHFIDSYNNLTIKTLMMLKNVDGSCSNNVRYLMKTDDDMYVQLKPLVNTLVKKNNSLLIGALHCQVHPIRDFTNKWYAPRYMFPDKTYPPYLSGTGYVMSMDIAQKLYKASMAIPIMHLEDVYLTGIVARSVRIKPRGDPGFSFSTRKMEPCSFQNAYTSHRVTPSDMRKIYFMLKNYKAVNCKKENISKEIDSTLHKIISFFSSTKRSKKLIHKQTCG